MIKPAALALALALAVVSGPLQAQEPVRRPVATLIVTDPGCVAGSGGTDRAEWLDEQRATYHLHLQLTSRERIHEGPVEVDIQPGKVIAYVPVTVTEPAPGEPVPTCLRPVTLELTVEPIARGNYDWQFRRGTLAEATAREAQARAEARGGPEPTEPAPQPAPADPAD